MYAFSTLYIHAYIHNAQVFVCHYKKTDEELKTIIDSAYIEWAAKLLLH